MICIKFNLDVQTYDLTDCALTCYCNFNMHVQFWIIWCQCSSRLCIVRDNINISFFELGFSITSMGFLDLSCGLRSFKTLRQKFGILGRVLETIYSKTYLIWHLCNPTFVLCTFDLFTLVLRCVIGHPHSLLRHKISLPVYEYVIRQVSLLVYTTDKNRVKICNIYIQLF